MSLEELEIEAMTLPPEEREHLAERLLWSLGTDLVYERERTVWVPSPSEDPGPPPLPIPGWGEEGTGG